MVFMTRILSFETDYPRVSRNPTRWSRGTKTLGTRLVVSRVSTERMRIRRIRINALATRDLAEKHVLKLVEGFFGHCRAV